MTQKFDNTYLRRGKTLSINYSFNQGQKGGSIDMLNAQRIATKIIDYFFSPIKAISSEPFYNITRDKVIINLFYFVPVARPRQKKYKNLRFNKFKTKTRQFKNLALNNNSINNLGDLLTKVFGRFVELRFVKLHYPYLDRTILAKYIAINAKKYNSRRIKRMILSKSPILENTESKRVLKYKLPSYILGVKIKISGRLITERVRPRKTTFIGKTGSFASGKGSLMDFGSYTEKNKHGAFTVKVWINQKIL